MVEYQTEPPRWPWWLWVSLGLAVLGSLLVIVGRLIDDHRLPMGQIVVLVVSLGVALFIYLRSRNPVLVKADDKVIRQPWPLRDVRWSAVDQVKAPGRWDDTVVLVLSDGSEKRTLFPPEYAERLAAVGNKPLR